MMATATASVKGDVSAVGKLGLENRTSGCWLGAGSHYCARHPLTDTRRSYPIKSLSVFDDTQQK